MLRRLTFNPGLMLTGFRTTRPWTTCTDMINSIPTSFFYKTKHSVLLCTFSVIDNRQRKNMVRTSVRLFFLPYFEFICDIVLKRNSNWESTCQTGQVCTRLHRFTRHVIMQILNTINLEISAQGTYFKFISNKALHEQVTKNIEN